MTDAEGDQEGLVEKVLGHLVATSSGDGRYARGVVRTVPLTVVASVFPDTIERDADGNVAEAVCYFEARFDRARWDVRQFGFMYTDTGVAKAVNDFLARLGYRGKVSWSEMGRQEDEVADFDMEYGLLDEIWPELRPAPPAPGPG